MFDQLMKTIRRGYRILKLKPAAGMFLDPVNGTCCPLTALGAGLGLKCRWDERAALTPDFIAGVYGREWMRSFWTAVDCYVLSGDTSRFGHFNIREMPRDAASQTLAGDWMGVEVAKELKIARTA